MGAPDPKPLSPVHAAIGLAAILVGAGGTAVSATRRMARAAAPLGGAVLRPPILPERLHLARAAGALANRGLQVVTSTGGDLDRLIAVVVPLVVREVLDTLDLNVVILERVDLDGLVAKVDVTEVIDRVDIDAVVRQVDVDAIVQRVDLDAVVRRVDVDAIVQRIDLDAIADRIDLDRIIARLDLVGLAEEVINEIDLPEIIRDSTGSVASHVVRDARRQSINADQAVSGLVDRLLRRRGERSTVDESQARAESDSTSRAERQP
jgi:hypothetical protein